jgi:hypothetical protein
MRRRFHQLIAAILLAMLPWQAFAGATMSSCPDAGAPAQSWAPAPCHDPVSGDPPGATHESLSGVGGCAQCHACSASMLPVMTGGNLASSPLQPTFASPAPIAGVVLEHLDPPPVG